MKLFIFQKEIASSKEEEAKKIRENYPLSEEDKIYIVSSIEEAFSWFEVYGGEYVSPCDWGYYVGDAPRNTPYSVIFGKEEDDSSIGLHVIPV